MMKNRFLKNFKLGIIGLGASFLLMNCQKDDTPLEQENVLATKSNTGAEWVGVDQLPSKVIEVISNGNKIEQSRIKQSSSRFRLKATDSVVKTVDTFGFRKYSFKSYVSYDTDNFYFENYIVALDPKDNIVTYTIRYQPEKKWHLENGIENLTNFTGKISYYSDDNTLFWEGELLNGKSNKNNKSFLKTESEFYTITITYEDCICHSTHATGGCAHPIMVINVIGGSGSNIPYYSGGGSGEIDDPTDPYHGGGGGSTPINSPTLKELAIFHIDACMNIDGLTSFLETLDKSKLFDLKEYLEENGCTTETKTFATLALEAWDNDGVEDGEVDFEEEILNELDGKALCVYSKLNQNSTNFAEAIQKFDGEFPVSHLKLNTVNDIPNNTSGMMTAGHTLPPENYITEIQFNEKFFNLSYSDITFARTMIHEVIHAEMYRKLLSISQTPDYTLNENTLNELKDDFPGMFDYYSRFFYDEYQEAHYNNALDAKKIKYFEKIGNDWQHELMATHYIDKMAQALYEFSGGAYTIEECEKFALGSFKDTVAWDALKNKNEIENFVQNVMTNGPKTCN